MAKGTKLSEIFNLIKNEWKLKIENATKYRQLYFVAFSIFNFIPSS